MTKPIPSPELVFLTSPDWVDYELLDSGGGAKLERYGPYVFARPEHQAVWQPALPPEKWKTAHAVFQATGEESGGRWQFNQPVEPSWTMQYKGLKFTAQATASRHMGVFPEQAAHWDWLGELVGAAGKPVNVLNLFGYTGLATLAAAQAGARVTHVDASKKAITWARQNQSLSGLDQRPIRWLVDDVEKFVKRELRRSSQYDGLILDPPKFGRGPEGQVWEFFDALPGPAKGLPRTAQPPAAVHRHHRLCYPRLGPQPVLPLGEMVAGLGGRLATGELALVERSAGRLLSTAIFARWQIE